ncbi:MAG: hypothetical protein HKN92_06150 [Chitinophagales bacterium]|nr:hypothetical protein [Chitinophagales bacterium]
MDDYGILIYLIGLVAYYIYRAYKKASKPSVNKQPSSTPDQQRPMRREQPQSRTEPIPPIQQEETKPKKGMDLDDIFREMFDIPEVTLKEEIEDKIEDRIDDVITSPKEVITSSSPAKKQEYKPSIQFNEADLLVGSTGKGKMRNRIRFNLKKAIIYNAILERPYK